MGASKWAKWFKTILNQGVCRWVGPIRRLHPGACTNMWFCMRYQVTWYKIFYCSFTTDFLFYTVLQSSRNDQLKEYITDIMVSYTRKLGHWSCIGGLHDGKAWESTVFPAVFVSTYMDQSPQSYKNRGTTRTLGNYLGAKMYSTLILDSPVQII